MKHRPKILLVDHTAALGGAELALLRLLREVDRTRFDCRVLLFSPGPLAAQLTQAGIPVEILPLTEAVVSTSRHDAGRTLLRFGQVAAVAGCIWRLARYLRAQGIDLVHTQSLKSHLIGGLASRLAARPCIWHLHIQIADDYLPRRVAQVFRRLAHWLPRYLIANSEFTLRSVQPCDPRRSWVVYPGIPLQEYTRKVPRPDRTADAEAMVGIIGRLSSTKGQDVFLRAGAVVLRSFPRVRLQLIGSALFSDRPYEAELRELARSLGIEEAVDFVGFVDDVPGRLEKLDLLVLASTLPEPFGQILVEAMAMGVPVIATDAGGVPEILAGSDGGMVVPPGDVERLAAAICEVLGDPARAEAMAQRGRARAAERFTIERTARDVEAIYTTVLAHRPGTARLQQKIVG